jgi:hypothetical protein
MRTPLHALMILLALAPPAFAGMDDPFPVTPRLDKVQFVCTSDAERRCTARLAACAGSPGSTSTSCCAEWTMCLNAYHCNVAGLHCHKE